MNAICKRLVTPFGILLLLLSAQAGAAAEGPREVITRTVDAVIRVLANEELDRVQRRDSIRALMHERFDFTTMSRSVLARNWRDATPEQRERFLELFPELLLHTYMVGLEGYSDETVTVEEPRMKGKAKAIVETAIHSQGKQIPVAYRLRENDGGWQIYDVIVEGVSLVNNYRGSFGSTIQKEGMDTLLENLVQKIEELRKPPQG